jgi:hypothetical protein
MNSTVINIFLIPLLLYPLLAQDYSSANSKMDLARNIQNESQNPSTTDNFCFTTFASKDRITLRWKVEKDKQTRGYKILRSEGEQGNYKLISSYESNPRLSRRALLTDHTQSYFVDLAVVPGTTYWYKLICIHADHKTTGHGPVSGSLPIHQQTSKNLITVSPKTFRFEPIHNSSKAVSTFRLDLPNYFESNHPAKVRIYNPHGEPLKTIFNGSIEAGSYHLVWKGDTEKGNIVTEGVYIAVFENDLIREATKLILMK